MSEYIKVDPTIKEIIKATLFVSGEGIEISDFVSKLSIDEKAIRQIIDELKKEMSDVSGIHLIEYKNKIQLSSNPNYADAIASILNPIREKALTKAALETLAIIAYKQPITRLEIEEIRGVGCDYAVQLLAEHNMIEIVGRKDSVGKPVLFGTTDEFLKRFSLTSILDLPDYEQLLDRIKVVETGEKTNSLYREYTISENEEEEVPEFLRGEELSKIIADDEGTTETRVS